MTRSRRSWGTPALHRASVENSNVSPLGLILCTEQQNDEHHAVITIFCRRLLKFSLSTWRDQHNGTATLFWFSLSLPPNWLFAQTNLFHKYLLTSSATNVCHNVAWMWTATGQPATRRWIDVVLMWCNRDIKGAVQMTEDHKVWRRFVASPYVLHDHETPRIKRCFFRNKDLRTTISAVQSVMAERPNRLILFYWWLEQTLSWCRLCNLSL